MNQMKKLLATLLLLITAVTFVIAQQPFVTLTGHVVNQETGAPVPGQPMYISVDSMNYPGYYNQVVTDGDGFYTDQIPVYPGTSQGIIMVSTPDCNGMMASATAAFFPGIQEVILDFSICGNPVTGCVASFRYVPSANDMLTFTFYDESYTMPGSTIDNRVWDFGDGITSSEQNPMHTYAEPGLYNVCLMISNNDSSCNSIHCIPVNAGSTNPGYCENYFWYYTDSTGTAASYTFEGWAANGQADSWTWDFGDGTTGSGQAVTHTFADPNMSYLVCLTTTGTGPDSLPCTAVSCQEVFNYIPSPCENYFWYSADSTGTGYVFEGWAMNGQIDSWWWDFGDGTTASGQSVTHTFAASNTAYNVCLTTSGIGPDGTACTSISCQEVYIYVPSPCESYFWYYPDSTGTSYVFEGWAMNNQIDSWNWDFGDGSTASGQTVIHSFTDPSAIHPVCLTTTGTSNGETCSYTSCQEVFIYIPSPCESYFWYYPDSSGTAGYTFQGWAMNGTSNNQIESWVWDFGDGSVATGQVVSHVFNDPSQVYTVCLTTTGTGPDGTTCTYTSCQDVFTNTPSLCDNYFEVYSDDGMTYSFTGYLLSGAPADYYWDFGDGSTGYGQQVTHTFQSVPGTVYSVCLTTITDQPATNDTCMGVSCQTIFPGGGGGTCEAVISAIPDPAGYTYYFEDLSQGEHSFTFWDFGDGEQSTMTNPVHTYTAPGIYYACLTIKDTLNYCWDQTCQEIWVNYVQPDCQASFFAFPSDSTSSSLSYQFVNTSSPGYTSQQWSFGDGTGSTEANPIHTYANPGIYSACLTIWDSTGNCQNTSCMEIFAGEASGDYTIAGIVMAGNTLANQGIVWLIGANNYYYAETTIDPSGTYNFGGVPAGSYYIYSMLTPGSPNFFEYLPTYYTSSLTWQGATIVTTGEPNGWYPISLVQSLCWVQGNAGITGTINWAGTFKSGGAPAANVEIVLYNSTGLPVAYTFSNSDGTFSFSNLPYGEYTLYAEMTGKITEAVVVILSEGSSTASINLLVTATAIAALGSDGPDTPQLAAGNPYPNPAGELLYLELNSSVSGKALVEVADLQGRLIFSESKEMTNGTNRIDIATGNLPGGMYLLRVSTAGHEPVQRRFVK